MARKRRKKRVEEPLTEDMLAELLDASDPRAFIKKPEVRPRDLSAYLNQLLQARGLKRAAVVRDAGLNETFGYQIFTGTRRASRDNLLKIAFALGLTLRETNRLLQAGGVNELYCKNRRDAIIIFAISHGYALQKTEEELYRFGEATIG
ncbi:helix-turn-helix domain-containing protein [Adlercreutzia caecimuris]|uniref:helix-turn-helix domain-containing protein n=1 Tax=Adlercreutzia caecimuris TaxID=671266 RepID=UPI00192A0826|nr:helix-turn-helix transcriptional regulator [Adlercreutzia caecimuris]